MHRSILCRLRRHIRFIDFVKTSSIGRHTKQTVSLPSSTIFVNSFHTSLRIGAKRDESEKDTKAKSRSTKEKGKKQSLQDDEQLQSAAINAAKSLPGDWTQTADDLMSRLAVHGTIEQPEDSVKEPSTVSSSLLSTMKVARNFERTRKGNMGMESLRQDGRDISVEDKMMRRKRLARRSENFTSLSGQPRLGIFDADKLKAEAGKDTTESGEDDLWQVVFNEKMRAAKGGLPRNGFEEMIEWTKEGRVWNFPVDNEQDMHEERQYKFHEHVFLSHHMGDFPTEGPLRRFMDLVVTGLSQNPWISVPEKVEHIRWYADYFRQKQQLLESSIGEKAKMKQS